MSWKPPTELDQPTPRRVRMSRSGRITIVLLAGIMPLPALILAAVGSVNFHDRLVLKERGLDAVATVSKLYITNGKGGAQYHADYEYSPQDQGQRVSGGTTLGEIDYHHMHTGTLLPVIYDPLEPKRSMVNFSDMIRRRNPAIAFRPDLIPMLLFGLLAVLFIWAMLWGAGRRKRLLRWGGTAAATVLGEREYKVKGKQLCEISYSFTDSRGQTITDSQNGVPAAGDQRAAILRHPTVLYDPDNSAKNVLYPSSFFEVY